MGDEQEHDARMRAFAGFQVTADLCRLAKPNWRFMHCLPRHKEEVSDDVFYGDRSVVWDEAENRKYTVMAVLHHLLHLPVPEWFRRQYTTVTP